MRRLISTTVGAVTAVALVALTLVAVVPPAGAEVSTAAELVHLPFDGSTADVTPSGNDAILVSGAVLDPQGQSGGAVLLDGDDDIVRLTDPTAIGGVVTARTVSVWFRADATADRQIVYEQGGATRGLNVYVLDGAVHVGGWNTPASESGWDGSWLSAPVDPGEWHHVALALDGGLDAAPGAFEAFVDGDSLGTAEGSQLYGGGTVGMGRNDGFTRYHDLGSKNATYGLAGRIDTVRIWDRVLSAAEIAELAGGGGPAENQAPVVDAGADQTVYESAATAVALNGSVTDDGLPSAGLTIAWTPVSAPPGATIDLVDAGSAQTTAGLSHLGAYTLRLTADDGELSTSDTVTVTVVADPVGGTVRVMAVGDSITEARDGPDKRGLPSWRKWFWDLAQADERDIDMVGSRSGVADGDDLTDDVAPPAEWGVWDWDHDGHYGWRADEILSGHGDQPVAGAITDWSQDHLPDVYLVHIGTNDLAQGGTGAVAPTIADIDAIVDAVRAVRPDARVALSQIITSRPKAKYPTLNDDIAALNSQIAALAPSLSTPASPVIAVDHATGWNVYVDNYDTLHPSVVGQQKMAQSFYDAVAAAGWLDGGSGGGGGPVNEAPSVEAGADVSVTEAEAAAGVGLDGSVSDDGLPASGSLTVGWSVDSAPAGGSAVFGDASSPSTTAVFTGATGAFVLRLSADDSELSGVDTVTVTVTGSGGGGGGGGVSTEDQLVDLPFDGTTADASGHGHDAVLEGGATIGPDGESGGALVLDGDDGWAALAGEAALTSDVRTRTLSVWFVADDVAGPGGPQTVYEQGGLARGLAVYVDDGQLHVGAWNDVTAESGWAGSWISTPVTAGGWHHVAVVLDGGDTVAPGALAAYLDGAPVGTAPGSRLWGHGTLGMGGANKWMRLADGTATKFDAHLRGRIDRLRMWDRTLSPAEIATLATSAGA